MLDNKNLPDFVKESLRFLPYQTQIEIYDKNCMNCPFKCLESVNGFGVRKEYANLTELLESPEVGLPNIKILRGCTYGGDYFTLKEITMNTCRFWKTETCEGGFNIDNLPNSFIEVTDKIEAFVHRMPLDDLSETNVFRMGVSFINDKH